MHWEKTLTGAFVSDNKRYRIEKREDVFVVFEAKPKKKPIGEAFTLKSAKHIAKKKERFNESERYRTFQRQQNVYGGKVQKSRRLAD